MITSFGTLPYINVGVVTLHQCGVWRGFPVGAYLIMKTILNLYLRFYYRNVIKCRALHLWKSFGPSHYGDNWPLSWRLDRCDRMIQSESRDPNSGNVRLFSAATCTSQFKWRSLRGAHPQLSALIYTFRESSLTLDFNGVFRYKSLFVKRRPIKSIRPIVFELHTPMSDRQMPNPHIPLQEIG